MNHRTVPRRIPCVATESDKSGQSAEPELAGAVHTMLAILTDLRRDMPAAELQDRIALVRWLRGELTDVEALLGRVHGRLAGAVAADGEPTPRP
jgi:hypothetical protein